MINVLLLRERKRTIKTNLLGMSSLLLMVMLIMLVGNLLQISIWSGVFIACCEFREFSIAFYHSVVNFTTLGYGDLVMSEKRCVLGALEAANGVLMFGLTTSFLFVILNDLMDREWNRRLARAEQSEWSTGRLAEDGNRCISTEIYSPLVNFA